MIFFLNSNLWPKPQQSVVIIFDHQQSIYKSKDMQLWPFISYNL